MYLIWEVFGITVMFSGLIIHTVFIFAYTRRYSDSILTVYRHSTWHKKTPDRKEIEIERNILEKTSFYYFFEIFPPFQNSIMVFLIRMMQRFLGLDFFLNNYIMNARISVSQIAHW